KTRRSLRAPLLPRKENRKCQAKTAGLLARGSSLRRAFPSGRTVAFCGFAPHSQWRARAGFAPDFPFHFRADGTEDRFHRIHLWLHYTGKADRLARGFGGADPERNCCDPLGKEEKARVPLRRRRCGNNRSFSIWERKGGSSAATCTPPRMAPVSRRWSSCTDSRGSRIGDFSPMPRKPWPSGALESSPSISP